MDNVHEITLSYTFFKTDEEEGLAALANPQMQHKPLAVATAT
jgi:cytochrome c oxidase assembly protein Cox11